MKCFVACIVTMLLSIAGIRAQNLRAKGTVIVNEQGDTVLLRGMGLGGWMLQEGYMFHLSGIGQQYRIKEKIADLVGNEMTQQFYDQWLTNHTTKKDIDSLAAWGFNSVRLPMHFGLFTLPVEEEPVKGQNTWLKKGFAITDSLLSWCSANKMYLILDLHATPGGQGNDLPIADRDRSKPSLWESADNRSKMIALWHQLALHYADAPWIGGYDIINEPNWGFEDPKDIRGTAEKSNKPLKELMMAVTKAIREADHKHIIIIEGNGFGNNYQGILPAWDDNMMLSFHKYGNFNTVEQINKFLELRDHYNIPLWMGESGENSNTWFTEAIRLVEQYGIGWAWWQLKKMGVNNPLEIKQPAGYDQLRAYWSGKGPKPSPEEAWSVLQQWLDNLETGNNIYHPDVIDAMFRQVYSTEPKPFKQIFIGDNTIIPAVDYDMGRQGHAYFDRDSARYQYTPGVNTEGNKGHAYRNDGVDIEEGTEGPYVFSIEDGEWMQYTVTISSAGHYNISFITASDKETGAVSLLDRKKTIIREYPLANTGGLQNWKLSTIKNISLKKGPHTFRLLAVKGRFNLAGIQFEKKK